MDTNQRINNTIYEAEDITEKCLGKDLFLFSIEEYRCFCYVASVELMDKFTEAELVSAARIMQRVVANGIKFPKAVEEAVDKYMRERWEQHKIQLS
jgi:hypothetical protein